MERIDVSWVDRALLQEVLGCSQTEAWRILKKLGAEPGPGGALVLAREVFLERVRAYMEDPQVSFELKKAGTSGGGFGCFEPPHPGAAGEGGG